MNQLIAECSPFAFVASSHSCSEGSCPICAESLRFSTAPLKGLPCGHTLHLECFQSYRRYAYTCPVCVRSMDDMREYFGRLDRKSPPDH